MSETNDKDSFYSLANSIDLIIQNLYKSLSYFLLSDKVPQIEAALLKVLSSLLNHTHLNCLSSDIIQDLIKAIFTKLKSDEVTVKSALLIALSAMLKDPCENIKPILSTNFIQGIFYKDDLHPERLQVLSRIARSYPDNVVELTI